MLTPSKRKKLQSSIKEYRKRYLNNRGTELDESGTRLMINSFLTDVLGYLSIDEIKTEYMIKGTYADYVIQLGGTRHFLVEVKALSLTLSDKHLRQAKHYGADEGIEWVVLTNGKVFELYKILFGKPIDSHRIFSIDLSDQTQLKSAVDFLQFLHKDAVKSKALSSLWSKHEALDPKRIAGLLYEKPVINFIKRTIKRKSKSKFTDEELFHAIDRIIAESIQLEDIKHSKIKKSKRKSKLEKDVKNLSSKENLVQ